MLSYALSTGTNLATSYFHLPFDEEEDADIENYERKYLTWVAEPLEDTSYSSQLTTPSSSLPSSPSSSRAGLSSSSSCTSLYSLVSDFKSSFSESSSSSQSPRRKAKSKAKSTPVSPTSSTFFSAPEHSSRPSHAKSKSTSFHPSPEDSLIATIVNENDLYAILGVPKAATLDKMTLRRAYLARSKACHPDKFPDNPYATQAFQKVAIAYDVLSTPSLKHRYDSRSPSSPYDVFAARPTGYAEETFRSVILGVFNDFLDGDLEVIRSWLKGMNDLNSGVKLGDEAINSVLSSLHSIRERALTCRTCIYALHSELTRLLEAQHAFSQLSYFDIMGRMRLTIQLTRIALGLPLALERALMEKGNSISDNDGRLRRSGCEEYRARGYCFHDVNDVKECGREPEKEKEEKERTNPIFPRHVMLLIRGIDTALVSMEKVLK